MQEDSADKIGDEESAKTQLITELFRVRHLNSILRTLKSQLEQSENKFRGLLEAAPDAFVIVNTEGRIEIVNAQAEEVFGYSRYELHGKPIEVLVPESLRDSHREHRRSYQANPWKRPLGIGHHLVGRRKDGSEFPVEIGLSPLETENGILMISVVRDITERKQAEEKLARFAQRLERSNRELEDFAYVASHDLQEPLRKIQAFGGRLKARCAAALDDQGRDYLERMQNAADRMQTLINELLTLSRVTTKVQPFGPVNLADIFREVVSDLQARIEQVGGCVEMENLPTIEADRLQMRQLFQNLISNALKFHRAEPVVVKIHGQILGPQERRVVGRPQIDGLCQITVQDNGIGFDEKYLDRIFNPFQRLHGRGEYEGTGMGLAICRKIVECHRGLITATSMPGSGATFIVTLPIRQPNGGDVQWVDMQNQSGS